MAVRKKPSKRDIQKPYLVTQFIQKLRRLADTPENGTDFRIQVVRERVRVSADARTNFEHERGEREEDIAFRFKWKDDSVTATVRIAGRLIEAGCVRFHMEHG